MALITGHEDPTKPDSSIRWEYLARGVDTLVFYMGVGNLPAIVNKLIANGRPPETPVALVQWGTLPKQRTVTGTLKTIVSDVKKTALKPPCIIIVGEVVEVRKKLNWFETLPLFGKRVINTRSRAQASDLSSRLHELGAEVLEFPTIETVPAGPDSPLAHALHAPGSYDWIIFTSPNGVRAFFDLLFRKGKDVRALWRARIASIGEGTTKEIERYHIKAHVTAREAVAEGLLRELKRHGPWKGKSVLLPRAEKARDVLPGTLRKWGARVTEHSAYRTVKPAENSKEILAIIEKGGYDLITFSSSSTFENFVELAGKKRFGRMKRTIKAASIGPVTTASLRKQGVRPRVEARDHTIPGLVSAIRKHLS
jgi:uroporphyrinogen III methyltransferase/synthase